MKPNASCRLSVRLGAALVFGMGCGALGRSTQPDAMSAEAHRSDAAEHGGAARESREQYDPDAKMPVGDWYAYPYSRGYLYRDSYWSRRQYNPTEHHLTNAREHERHMREHLEAARVLEEFEEGYCSSFPPETRVACPLLGHVEAVEDVFDGVRVRLDESIDMNAAVAHMRCHVAFARVRARVGMDDCPLYLRGVHVERVGNSRSVDLIVADRHDLDDLRDRARGHARTEPRE